MKYLFTLLLLAVTFPLLSQDLYIPNNPYESAPDFVKQRKSFNRERHFYEQRMFPNNFIPENAYKNAQDQRNAMRSQQGFYDNVNDWVNIGPTSGSYFSYGNISSRITTIQYDPVTPTTIYLGAAFGGVWKSTNSGVTWVSKTDNEVSLSSGSIAIDPTNTNIIYYGTGEATYSAASYYGRGVLKSTNGGNTWTNYTTGLPSLSYTSRLVIRPGFPNQLFAAMGTAGFFKSTDAGVTWSLVQGGRCDDVVFSPNGMNCYILGSGTGYRVSTDGGATFTLNGTLPTGTRNHIAICRDFPNVLYAARHSSSSIFTYKSTDAGVTFTPIATSTNFNGGQAWYDFYMHVNPFDPNYAYVGSIDIWRTTDGGSTFANITNGYSGGNVHVDQQNMAFHPTNSNELFATNDGGVWRSIDRGTTFINLNATLTLTQFYRIASDYNNAAHILGGTQDNGTQRTLGTTNWTGAFGGDGGEVCFHPQSPLNILGETQNNGVQRSNNGGTSWFSGTSGLTGSGAWVAPIISHPDSALVFYTARQQVFKTTVGGSSWFPLSTGTSGQIREMAICKSNPAVMYATVGFQIFRSTDRGYTFTNVTSGTPGRTITSIYAHPDSSNVAVVSFSGFGAGKVYKTYDGGASWHNISGNLPDTPINDVLIYHPGFSTKVLFAATDVGVFITNNNGATWSELANGLPNTVAIHLDYNQASNKLRIGTHGRGVYELTSLTGIQQQNSTTASSYSLSQNYPNPFNPVTKIKYSIPAAGNVSIKVYNTMGKEVGEIVNKQHQQGEYEAIFNASNLSSGVYFYTIRAGQFAETRKMMLMK